MQLFVALPSMMALASVLTLGAPDSVPPASCAARQPGARPQAFVAVAPATRRDTAVIATVCVKLSARSAARLGSYHGELHFDTSLVRSVRVVKADGGMRVENATVAGQVNFAGADPTGFADGALVKVVLRLRTAGARPALNLEMKELNTVDGVDLMKQMAATP